MSGMTPEGIIGNLVTSQLRLDHTATPRWVRERKRFDREHNNRVELWLMELEKYTYKTFRETIYIRYELDKLRDMTQLAIERGFKNEA